MKPKIFLFVWSLQYTILKLQSFMSKHKVNGQKIKNKRVESGQNNIGSFVKHYLANVLLMLDCISVLYYRLLFVIEVCRETDSGKSFVRGKKSSHTSNHVHLRVSF